jgi:hypothetical protein
LSVDELQLTLIVVSLVPVALRIVGVDGALVSGVFNVVTEIVLLLPDELLDVSKARTEYRCVVAGFRPVSVNPDPPTEPTRRPSRKTS